MIDEGEWREAETSTAPTSERIGPRAPDRARARSGQRTPHSTRSWTRRSCGLSHASHQRPPPRPRDCTCDTQSRARRCCRTAPRPPTIQTPQRRRCDQRHARAPSRLAAVDARARRLLHQHARTVSAVGEALHALAFLSASSAPRGADVRAEALSTALSLLELYRDAAPVQFDGGEGDDEDDDDESDIDSDDEDGHNGENDDDCGGGDVDRRRGDKAAVRPRRTPASSPTGSVNGATRAAGTATASVRNWSVWRALTALRPSERATRPLSILLAAMGNVELFAEMLARHRQHQWLAQRQPRAASVPALASTARTNADAGTLPALRSTPAEPDGSDESGDDDAEWFRTFILRDDGRRSAPSRASSRVSTVYRTVLVVESIKAALRIALYACAGKPQDGTQGSDGAGAVLYRHRRHAGGAMAFRELVARRNNDRAQRQLLRRARRERRALATAMHSSAADGSGLRSRRGRRTRRAFITTATMSAVAHARWTTPTTTTGVASAARGAMTTRSGASDARAPALHCGTDMYTGGGAAASSADCSHNIEILFVRAFDRRSVLLAERLWAHAEHEIKAQQRRQQASVDDSGSGGSGNGDRDTNAPRQHASWSAHMLRAVRPVAYVYLYPRVPAWCSWAVSLMIDTTAMRLDHCRAAASASHAPRAGERRGEAHRRVRALALLYLLRQPMYERVVLLSLARWRRRGVLHLPLTRHAAGGLHAVLRATMRYYFYTCD